MTYKVVATRWGRRVETDFPSEHDLRVQETLLKACALPLED